MGTDEKADSRQEGSMSREAMTVEEIQHIREWASGQKHDLPKRFMQGDGMWAAIRAVCDEALRAALNETPEPVAWLFVLDGCRQVMLDEDADEAIRHHGIPLYRHPPAASLTDEEILKCNYKDVIPYVRSDPRFLIQFARAAIAAATEGKNG